MLSNSPHGTLPPRFRHLRPADWTTAPELYSIKQSPGADTQQLTTPRKLFEPSSQTGVVATVTHKTIPVVGRERTRAGVAGPLDTPIHIAILFVCGFVDSFVADQNFTSENTFEFSFFRTRLVLNSSLSVRQLPCPSSSNKEIKGFPARIEKSGLQKVTLVLNLSCCSFVRHQAYSQQNLD